MGKNNKLKKEKKNNKININRAKDKVIEKPIESYIRQEYTGQNVFLVMVGPSGSGKSTKVTEIKSALEEYDKIHGYNRETIVLSSDKIRVELYGEDYVYDKSKNQEVFSLLHKRIKDNCDTSNIIIDATNLTIKTRRSLFNCTKKSKNVFYVAYVMNAPILSCTIFNNQREGTAKVPEEVIEKHIKAFEIPIYEEGIDKILIQNATTNNAWTEEELNKLKIGWDLKIDPLFNIFKGFDQKNPHHKYTLDEHTRRVIFNICNEYYKKFKTNPPKSLIRAASLHDLGKFFVGEEKLDENNNPTGHYRYKGHANYGTYYILYCIALLGFNNMDDIIDCLAYINYHMEPFAWKTELKDGTKIILPKTIKKMKERYKKYFDNMMFFNECDKKATGTE